MWKLIAFIGSLIALSWDDILEAVQELSEHGVSYGALITAILLWSKLRNNKRFKEHDERLEAKQRAIMNHLGVPWDWDAERNALSRSTAPTLYRWLLMGLYHARGAGLSTIQMVIDAFRLRRGRRMNISKAWLSGVVAYLLGNLALKYGFTFKVEWADTIAEIIITVILPLVIAWMNRKKKGDSYEPTIQPGSFK